MEEPKNVAVESAVETETTQTSSPQVEAETTTPQTKEETVEELPNATDEQRKAFQEMRLENKRLKEEMEARQRNESAFDQFKPKPVAPVFNSEQFTDPYTGEFNWEAYSKAQEQTIAAKVTSQIEERIAQEKDEETARNLHPELFKDPEIEQEIADRWVAAKLRGENATVTEIADRVSKRFSKALNKAEQLGAERALNEVSPKEQVALSTNSQSSGQAQRQQVKETNSEELNAIRFGNEDVLANAMSKVPWANK